MKRRKVLISACLLGEYCRYDGASKSDNAVIERFREDDIIPFCPEAPVLGTPRERISVIENETGLCVIGDASGKDFTKAVIAQVEQFIQNYPDLDLIVLKSKSPSCGLGTTPILNAFGNMLRYGNGIAAQRLKEAYPDIQIVDEVIINKGE